MCRAASETTGLTVRHMLFCELDESGAYDGIWACASILHMPELQLHADLEAHRVIYVTEGKDSTTVNRFVEDFHAHGGKPDDIQIVTCDMALGFRKGINDNFKNSTTIIDKFHVINT